MTVSVHCTTVHDVDDETVDADLKEMAGAISRRGQSSSSSDDDAYFSAVGTGITRRGRSSYSSEQTQDISRTSGVTIQHGVDVDDVQSSSENAKTPLLQLAQEISIAAYGSGASEQGRQDSSLKMHEANEARTLSLKTLEEVNPAQQYKEHSDVLFASTVHAKRHTTGVGKHVKSSSQVDFNPGYGDDVGFNVIGGSDHEQLKKSTVVTNDGGDAGVNPKMVKSDTKVAVQSDESPIVVSSDSEDKASKKEKEDKTRKVTADTKQSEKPRFHMIEANWLQSKLDSVDHVEALYSLGANFILHIELLSYPTVNIDAWDENISREVQLRTIDAIAERTRQHLWCTEVGIINTAPEVVEFHEPRNSRGVSWPQSYGAIMYAVDPGPVMYANELVICEEDLPKFYVCSTTGGERTFAAIESKALPRKSLERVTLMTSTCKLNSQQTLTNFININGRQYPKDARIWLVPDPMIVIKSTEVRLRVGSQIKVQCMGTINCSKYSSAVKCRITPRMPEDMREKRIRLIHSLTGRYSMDFNYHDLFSTFFARCRMEKEMDEEEEQKMDKQKFREFGTESDEDDDDAKEEDQQEEKEREVSKNKEKGGGKVEEEEQDDKWEEKEGNQFDYARINEYINNHRDKQLRRQEIPFGPEKKVDEKNTWYKYCKDYMEKNKEVKLVTPLHEVSTLRFRAANYLCAKRRSSSSMYLPKMSTYDHIENKAHTRRMKKVIHIRRSIGFKRISSSQFMRKRSFTSVNVNADKIRKIQFEPNTPLQISTKQLKKRKPSSMRTVKYCAAVYKARKQTIFRTFLANGGKLEDFPISDTESESDSDTVEMKSIQVVKVVHPELQKVTQDCEDGTKCVDRYLTLFKTCTEQKDKGSTTSKDVVYKI